MVQIDITLKKMDIAMGRLVVFFGSGLGVGIVILALTSIGLYYLFGSANDRILLFLIFSCLVIPGAVAFAGINSAAVKKMLVPLQYRFNDHGIELIAPHVTGHFDWSDVRRAYESGRLFVFSTPGTLQIIPKRFMSSDSLTTLKALVRTNLKRRAKFKT